MERGEKSVRNYFVDESGDSVLFSRKGKVSVVHNLDDTRQADYGVYYTRKKPLTLAALEDLPGI